MITLYQFPDSWGLQPSPFCLKMATWLRMADLPYRSQPTVALSTAPTGKLPYIATEDGRTVGDSALIIDFLRATAGADPDDGLSDETRAVATAITRLLEDHLYFIGVYFRWIDDIGWAVTKPAFFGRMPLPLRAVVPALLRRRVRRMLWAQGLGRHDRDQLGHMGAADLNAIATFLGDKPFLLDDRPRSVDASAYGLLANLLYPPLESPLKQALLRSQALVDYCDRIRSRFWAETVAG